MTEDPPQPAPGTPSVVAATPPRRDAILVPAPRRTPPLDTRARALLELMDDGSEAVWDALRREFERDTPGTRRIVETALQGARARARGRARRVLAYWTRRLVVRRLVRHVVRPRIDLERALFLLGRLDQFDLDARPYRRVLETLADEVRTIAEKRPEGLGRSMALVEVLRERKFTGDLEDYSHPHNIHLHRAIERRAGMPLTLTSIYLFVARRAGLRAAAIPMPGHVFLRLYAERRSIIVDPFHGGELRTRRDLTEYLSEHGLIPQPAWFRDADDAYLLHRHVLNLMNSCRRRSRDGEARELQAVAKVLAETRGKAELRARASRS